MQDLQGEYMSETPIITHHAKDTRAKARIPSAMMHGRTSKNTGEHNIFYCGCVMILIIIIIIIIIIKIILDDISVYHYQYHL